MQKCPGSGTEVSRAELCPGSWPCSVVVCGRRWLWQSSGGAGGGGRSFPSSPAVSLAQQVAVSLIPGKDPAAGAIISSRQAAPSEEILITLFGEAGEGRLSLSRSGKNRGMSLQHRRAPARDAVVFLGQAGDAGHEASGDDILAVSPSVPRRARGQAAPCPTGTRSIFVRCGGHGGDLAAGGRGCAWGAPATTARTGPTSSARPREPHRDGSSSLRRL